MAIRKLDGCSRVEYWLCTRSPLGPSLPGGGQVQVHCCDCRSGGLLLLARVGHDFDWPEWGRRCPGTWLCWVEMRGVAPKAYQPLCCYGRKGDSSLDSGASSGQDQVGGAGVFRLNVLRVLAFLARTLIRSQSFAATCWTAHLVAR